MSDIIWDLVQQCQIDKLNKNADSIRDVVAKDQAQIQGNVSAMEERFSSLALITRALFELLAERAGLTEQDLAKKMNEIDLRDGKADGKMSATPKKCPSCGSVMSTRFNRCLFCGYQERNADPFNAVK